MNTLIQALTERAAREGWTGRELCREIGISDSTWSMMRLGNRGVGIVVALRIVRRFPEYMELVMADRNTDRDAATDEAA